MKPFDDYPGEGYTLLPMMRGANARREYGHWLVQQGQTSCAYCGVSLTEGYQFWLLLTVDHVIPKSECARLGIPRSFGESYSNIVLACSGCNGLDNRYTIGWQQPGQAWTEEEFFTLRDRVFQEKAERKAPLRHAEIGFFEREVKGQAW